MPDRGLLPVLQYTTSTVKISLPLPIWGGFYAAPDGNFYVAVGQQNPKENDDLVVVKILKYNRAWNLLGTTDISGGYSNMSKGIYIPFAAASLRMTQIGSTLIIHTGREMYSINGVHHQSDITFVIDTQTMTLIDSDMPYNSHSFNQFVVNDGKMFILWITEMLFTEDLSFLLFPSVELWFGMTL